MASIHRKGAAFLLVLLSLAFVSGTDVDIGTLIERQEEHLDALRELVGTLSGAVSRLETAVSDVLRSGPFESKAVMKQFSGDRGSDSEKSGISVKKGRPLWFGRFQLLAEARLEVDATCAAVLPYLDVEGISKYFALGDVRGRVIIFSSAGDALVESETPSGSPVTAIHAYMPVRKNESVLLTGHADGSVIARKVWESRVSSEDWFRPVIGMPHVLYRGGEIGDSSPVKLLDAHQIGRMMYVLGVNGEGRIRVFTENGTLYGVTSVSRRPLAFMKQRNFFLTEKGAGWLDFRRMVASERECEGLNGSLIKSYVFDVSERSKAYGITLEGNLIHVMILGDAGNYKCRVRALKKSEIGGNASLLAIKGYLLAVNHEKVFMYNISSQYHSRAGASRPVLSATLLELRSLFTDSDIEDGSTTKKPLIAGDREKLVVLGLGGRYIGIYRPNIPILKVQSNIVFWSSPALLFFLFLLGMWYLYVKKRSSMGFTPGEPFLGSESLLASGLLGSASSDKHFLDSQRSSDLRDVRSNVLRDPSRRYASPSSRYPGRGTPMSYTQSPADPGFVGSAELKYRGSQALDPSGFPLRRDTIFVSNRALDEQDD